MQNPWKLKYIINLLSCCETWSCVWYALHSCPALLTRNHYHSNSSSALKKEASKIFIASSSVTVSKRGDSQDGAVRFIVSARLVVHSLSKVICSKIQGSNKLRVLWRHIIVLHREGLLLGVLIDWEETIMCFELNQTKTMHTIFADLLYYFRTADSGWLYVGSG